MTNNINNYKGLCWSHQRNDKAILKESNIVLVKQQGDNNCQCIGARAEYIE